MQAAAAQGQYAGFMIDPAVSDEAKLIAAAVVSAGAQIAAALYHGLAKD